MSDQSDIHFEFVKAALVKVGGDGEEGLLARLRVDVNSKRFVQLLGASQLEDGAGTA